MKTDYPELEGKELDYIYKSGTVNKARVVGVSYSIGLTIVNIADPNKYHICLRGKLSPKKGQFKPAIYRKLFHQVVAGIKAGRVYSFELTRTGRVNGGRVNPNTCAFGQ